jgi:hypothetical protein
VKRPPADLRVIGRARGPKRCLPYPAGGQHALYLTAAEWHAVTRAAGDLSLGSFVRRAVLTAAGVASVRHMHPSRGAAPSRTGRIPYVLSRAERDAVDAARRDRDMTAWVRDVVRAAAGLRRSYWSPCADAVVRKGFRRWDIVDMLRALPGRTAETITARAKHLGCSTALGEERVSLKAAAARAGYHHGTLRRMLTEAGVPPVAIVGTKPNASRRRLVVRLDDVVRVVRENCRRAA